MAEVPGNQARHLVTRWLIDTSALGQRSNADVHARLASCIEDGAAVCDMVVAESLIRSRGQEDLLARQRFFEAIDVLPIDDKVWSRVGQLAQQLAESAEIVATSHAIIAACASEHDLIVLHYDSDFQTLGDVCGIDHEWVAPNGSL